MWELINIYVISNLKQSMLGIIYMQQEADSYVGFKKKKNTSLL